MTGPTHQDIMDGLTAINARLAAGDERFARIDAAIHPLTDLIVAMGGEAQFRDLAIDAARGLAALAWVANKAGVLMKWMAAIAAGAAVVWAAVRFITFDMWRMS